MGNCCCSRSAVGCDLSRPSPTVSVLSVGDASMWPLRMRLPAEHLHMEQVTDGLWTVDGAYDREGDYFKPTGAYAPDAMPETGESQHGGSSQQLPRAEY